MQPDAVSRWTVSMALNCQTLTRCRQCSECENSVRGKEKRAPEPLGSHHADLPVVAPQRHVTAVIFSPSLPPTEVLTLFVYLFLLCLPTRRRALEHAFSHPRQHPRCPDCAWARAGYLKTRLKQTSERMNDSYLLLPSGC